MQAFGVPAFLMLIHIHRLLYRWGLSTGKNVTQSEKDAKRLFPKERWNDLHLQIIWYGREYCPARGWDLSNDIITLTIGRASVLKEYNKSSSNSKALENNPIIISSTQKEAAKALIKAIVSFLADYRM